ncbi:Immune inhibitor A peptidase M6 [Halobacillus karajensis]|uniref:choice-of-anchor J domain-containing protein n=1 Tax=Halobacillus karajensis TaxID=195088 RepID=UPI0008A7FF69|nr:choice-of-anchor J domain-containing protein [Halobacillus karajensis]SEH46509.1 Immune inhibitor A peptidase M6 [Halobacillus karajensis]
MLKNKKLTALLSAGALTLSMLSPATVTEVSASKLQENWNVERYSDKLDIDSELQRLDESESFQKEAKKTIRENASEVHWNDEESNESDSHSKAASMANVGETKSFLTRNLTFKDFTLQSVGEHAEVWVANDLSFPEGDDRPAHVVTKEQADKMAAEFDANMYPVATDFFGTPDSLDGTDAQLEDMGIVPEGYYKGDGDKVIILVDNVEDENYNDPDYPFFVAGFFWQTLENYMDRNIITIDSRDWDTRLESTFFGTTIHELQHLIHADNDGDETSWLNEGMSTFSEYLGGYGLDSGSINFLLDHPENSLTNWDEHVGAETGPETIADYGLVQLFTLYNYERFGQEFIRSVALEELNSIESFEKAYKDYGLNVTFNEVYQDFSTALVVDDPNFKGGKYGFENIDLRSLPVGDDEERGKTVNFEKAKDYEKEGVPAWGTDFKEFTFEPGQNVESFKFNGVDFEGNTWTSVQDPLGSDNQVLSAGTGDELDNNLIFEADLTDVDAATLSFDHLVDIEEAWDYGVVQVSTDQGQTWTSLENENTRSDVVEEGYPKIKENVPGFTGHFDDYQSETFDLSEYAGQTIHVSFRYLTDWGYNDTGWFIDNIEVPEIGLSFNGNTKDGFMSKAELLKNYVDYGVTFIKEKNNGKYQVVEVDPFNVTKEDALELQQVFRPGKTYMTTYYAAPQDSLNPVDFEYEINYKNKGPHKKE